MATFRALEAERNERKNTRNTQEEMLLFISKLELYSG